MQATQDPAESGRVPGPRTGQLKITEIFHSLQGEARDAGFPTVFIRLTGCPLRCVWCDSEYAFRGGDWVHIDDIIAQVLAFDTRHVCVTGGEPLAQRRCLELLTALSDRDLEVSLETSGAIDVSEVDPRVSRVVDLKAPDSGESGRNLWANLDVLTRRDQVKFVIASRGDYEWSRDMIRQHSIDQRCDVLLSPVWESQAPAQLAEWVLEDRLPVRMQMQLHKLLWGDEPGR